MKVLFLSNDPNIFDAGSPVRLRMRAYASAIGELHIVSCAPSGAQETHEGNLSLYPIYASRFFSFFALSKLAKRLIREKDIEVVSAQDPFEHGLSALHAIRGTKAKLHIQVHTDFLSRWFSKESLKNRIRLSIASRVLPCAQGIRSVSERVKGSLVMHYGSRISVPSVIPIAVSSSVPPPAVLPPHSFSFTLITVGRLEKEKRIKDILTALASVIKKYPSSGLFIVGEGRERRHLERLTEKLGLSHAVVFLGKREDAQGLMQSAHTFIQASAYEGYGRTLIEAALAKIPIITTDVGIVGEIFKPFQDVLASAPQDVGALAKNISRLIEDNPLRRSLMLSAENAVHAHLKSPGALIAEMVEDLARTLQKG